MVAYEECFDVNGEKMFKILRIMPTNHFGRECAFLELKDATHCTKNNIQIIMECYSGGHKPIKYRLNDIVKCPVETKYGGCPGHICDITNICPALDDKQIKLNFDTILKK
jgi:hypothetical protein